MSKRETRRMRRLGKVLFVLYIIFLLYFLLFSEWYGRTGVSSQYRYNLVLFNEIKRFIEYREELGPFAVFTNLFGNVLIFMPFGFFIAVASKSRSFLKTVLYAFCLSLGVEIFQLLTRVGSFDVDDLFLNTVGGAAGYISFMICNAIRRKHYVRKRERR